MSALWQSGMLCYPERTATHEEVVASKDLFQSTLESLNTHLGIKLKVPKVGGIEVDLHLLYKEVTGLGGVDLVISRKQWVIVCEPFNFPASFTNKSFVIKKLYLTALYHYEQLYYHRRSAPPMQQPMAGVGGDMASSDSRFPKRKPESESGQIAIVPGHSSSSGSPSAPSTLEAGTRFTGIIDCSFEHGFMITLDLPTHRLQGVLYKEAPPHLMLPSSTGAGAAAGTLARRHEDTAVSQELESGVATAAKRPRMTGPGVPRPARTPYQFFQLGVNKDQLLQLHPDPTAENAKDALPKLMSDLWHQMTPEQRQPFLDMGEKDIVRYQRECMEYNRRLQMGSPGGGEELQEARLLGGGGGPAPIGTPTASIGPSPQTPGAPKRPPYPRQIRIGVPLKPRSMSLPSHLATAPALPAPHMHAPYHHHMLSDPIGHHHHYNPGHLNAHRLHSHHGMPPPRPAGPPPLGTPPVYEAVRSSPARIASAPGFHLLPSDMDAEDLEHLCYYPGAEQHTASHHRAHHGHHGSLLPYQPDYAMPMQDHHMQDHDMHEDPASHLVPLPDHHHTLQHQYHHSHLSQPSPRPQNSHHNQLHLPAASRQALEHHAGRPAHQEDRPLQQRQPAPVAAAATAAPPVHANLPTLSTPRDSCKAEAAACAGIDQYGCNTAVQVGGAAQGGGSADGKREGSPIPTAAAALPCPLEGVAQGHPPGQSLSGQELASLSAAASPSDQPASQTFHGGHQGYPVPAGGRYGGMYDGTLAASSPYEQHIREQADHDMRALPHMFD